ncbi:hypothetical protein GKQ23_10900 [Erwinia sp. E602]|uniref:hypothetical protein n=1 Tax=unclassified Erwinia TaxID=2622719 RepID=UPI0007017676|nr:MULTISPECIES: hypothetical protein [unclassified Erwinia]KQN63638.1 hypothetical protein ASF13_18850 [Erwinia sp. Leaf53]QUG75463.1 hypothetical protein GKQ23_10900 [Erwinia sp. E602]
MADKEFLIYKRASDLFHSRPRDAELLKQLEMLSDEAEGDILEARMIGNLISGTILEMHEVKK